MKLSNGEWEVDLTSAGVWVTWTDGNGKVLRRDSCPIISPVHFELPPCPEGAKHGTLEAQFGDVIHAAGDINIIRGAE